MTGIALQAGNKIAGYEIKRVIGAGGFGITYEGHNPITDNRVAIKEFFPKGIVSRTGATIVLNDERDRDIFDQVLKKFEEATSRLCKLIHPNIVRVHDYIPGNRTGYMLMEFLDGDSLRGRLDKSPAKALSGPAEFAALFMPIADAMRYVHTNGILHRDLSPDNIMIDRGGRPVLIDFGALRSMDTPRRVSTLVVAREAYAPPEQLIPDGPLHAPYTDIYALAATMYEAIAGEPPVRSSNRLWGSADPYVTLGQKARFACGPNVVGAIDRALQMRPEARPQSIAALEALLGFAAAQPPPVPREPPPIPRAAQRVAAQQGSLMGRVIAFDQYTGAGLIATSDGSRYTFTHLGLLDARLRPEPGMEVEFMGWNGQASAVMLASVRH